MQETEMTIADKKNLSQSIKLSLIIGILFFIAFVFIIGIIPAFIFFCGRQPQDGFVNRGLFILGLLFIPFIAISWKDLLKFIDTKQCKKYRIESSQYEIQKTKRSVYISIIDNPEQRIEIWEELIPLLNLTQPVKIEIAKISKTIIFISNGSENLLDK